MKFKILTYNIHKGYSALGANYTLTQIKEAIQKTQTQICFLQEVIGIRNANNESDIIENQFEYLADTVWPYFSYGKNASYPKGHHGNAILSSLPIIKENNVSLTLNKYEHRGLLHLVVKDPTTNKELHLLNTHLNLRTKDRQLQIQTIGNYIDSHIKEDEPLILCGDFNDWNGKIHSVIIKELNLGECHIELGKALPKTFPSLFPIMRLDRIYFKNLKVHSADTLSGDTWTKASDHLPICAEFEL